MILVDTNVLLDVLTEDPVWANWSERSLADFGGRHGAALNPIIYAEVSVGFPTADRLDGVLDLAGLIKLPLPYEAAFLAGKAFLRYRRRGGMRTAPLPDFYIGAHASVSGLAVLTRDPRRFRTYFPSVSLLAP